MRALVDAGQERRAPVRRVALGEAPARGSLITTNPGRFWLSLPRPYVTQEPTHGKPIRAMPVFIMKRAGEWLFDSVKTEWRNAILSTCRPRFGKISETILPHSPRGLNRNGDFINAPTCVLEEAGRVLERRVELADRLAVPALERGLVVPGVDLAGPAVDEDPDDPLGRCREMPRVRSHWILCERR